MRPRPWTCAGAAISALLLLAAVSAWTFAYLVEEHACFEALHGDPRNGVCVVRRPAGPPDRVPQPAHDPTLRLSALALFAAGVVPWVLLASGARRAVR